MRYSRAALEGRNWHKIIIGDLDRMRLAEKAFPSLTGDYMLKGGGHWMLVMIDTDDDLVLFRLMTNYTEYDYRGYGNWSKKKYNSAKGNRMEKKQ